MTFPTIEFRYGFPFCQYFGLRTSVHCSPRVNLSRMKGPVPTGAVSEAGFVFTSVPPKTCFGRIHTRVRERRNGPNARFSVMTTFFVSLSSMFEIAAAAGANGANVFADSFSIWYVASDDLRASPTLRSSSQLAEP